MERPATRCGTCDMYHGHLCTLVAGHIDPGYVCDRWTPIQMRK